MTKVETSTIVKLTKMADHVDMESPEMLAYFARAFSALARCSLRSSDQIIEAAARISGNIVTHSEFII